MKIKIMTLAVAVIAVCGAFATTSKKAVLLDNIYAVSNEESTYYVLQSSDDFTGRQGTDPGEYTCENPQELCTIETNQAAYTVGSEIRVNKSAGEILTPGTFTLH